jgi:hypothetical protein
VVLPVGRLRGHRFPQTANGSSKEELASVEEEDVDANINLVGRG